MKIFVFILRSTENNLYIGQTNDLLRRLEQHPSKTSNAAKFIKDENDFKLVYYETDNSRLNSMRREKQLKV